MSKKTVCYLCSEPRLPNSAYCRAHKREKAKLSMRRLRADPVRGPEMRDRQRNWFKENREKWNAYLRQYRAKAAE